MIRDTLKALPSFRRGRTVVLQASCALAALGVALSTTGLSSLSGQSAHWLAVLVATSALAIMAARPSGASWETVGARHRTRRLR